MTTMSTNILRDTLAHFAHMPADEARRASTRLRDEIYAALDDIGAGHALAGLYTDEARDAELYRQLHHLFASPTRPGVSVSGTRALLRVLKLVEDICGVLEDSGEKKLADVLYERLDDYTVRPGPLSRLIDLWESR